MRISKFKLKNFISFYDEYAEDIELGSGVNFIVGKNNSGKTALLDALCLRRPRAPHRSVETIPTRGVNSRPFVDFEVEFEFKAGILIDILQTQATDGFISDWPSERTHGRRISLTSESRRSQLLGGWLNSATDLRIRYNSGRLEVVAATVVFNVVPSGNEAYWEFKIGDDKRVLGGDIVDNYGRASDNRPPTCWEIFLDFFVRTIYRLEAERPLQEKVPVRRATILEPNASNLAQVLRTAREDRPHRYRTYESLVTSVFPFLREFLSTVPPDIRTEEEYLQVYVGY